nr:hypothetical protein [Tanacetum cinerariifolium]
MLEKDMYDSWKNRMELYMRNRQHGQMIFESVQNGPLIWPTIEENGVSRLRKYSELTPAESIQADWDVKQLTSFFKVYLQRSMHWKESVNFNQQPQQYEFPQLDSGLTVLVFKKGDDPIDAINHMMSFFSAVVTSRYPTTTNQLRNSSNPRQQATVNDGRVIVQPVQRTQEKDLVITALKDELRKLKGKDLADNTVTKHTIAPEMLKVDVEPLAPRLLNNRTVHSDYLRLTSEQAVILREVMEQRKSQNPLNNSQDHACKYTIRIQKLLILIKQTCHNINNSSEKLVAVTPKNKDKRVRFTEPVTSSENTNTKIASSSNLVSNKPALSSTGVKPSTSASGSQASCNTKKNKIQRPPSGTAIVKHSKLNVNSELICVKCNGCMLSDNHDLCVLNVINDVNLVLNLNLLRKIQREKSGNQLARITTSAEVPLRKPTAQETDTPKPVVTLVYSRKPKKLKTSVLISKPKIIKSISANNKEPSKSWGSIVSNVLPSSLNEFRLSKLFSGTIKFGDDHVAKIIGYGDYQNGNFMILRVYYVEGLGHNLFSIGQLCNLNLEVAFCQHTCFIRNLKGDDLLTGSRGNNLYTLSLGDMMASSPICLLSKVAKTKSWLWHRRLSHLNFSTINHLARRGLVRGLPKLKFEKDHLCSACAMGKSKKKPYIAKSEDTNQEKLYLLHMDLCGPIRVTSVNGKKCILVIVDDHSWFTWTLVRRIRTDNETKFVNQTLREYYEKVDFDELAAMASKHSSLETVLHEMTPVTICLELVPNLPPSTPPEVIALINDVVALEPAESTSSPSSTTVNQDAPSASNSQTSAETQSLVISNDVEEENHDLDVAHMNNDLFFGIPILENDSESSFSDVIPSVVHTSAPNSENVNKWTKDHPLDTIIGELEGPVMDIKEKDKIEAKIGQNQAGNGKRAKVMDIKEKEKIEAKTGQNPARNGKRGKIDYLFDEFAGELILLKSIPSGTDETDCNPKEEIRLIMILLYDNSSPRPPKEFISKNSDAAIESFSSSPIPIEDKLLSNDSFSLPKNEPFHFDILSSPRPLAKPPDDDEIKPNSEILTVKVVGDISEHDVPMPRLLPTQPTLASNKEKSLHLLSYQGFKAFRLTLKIPMIIYGGNTPILEVLFLHLYPP